MNRSYSKIKLGSIVQLAIALLFLLPIIWIVLAALNPPGTALLRSIPLETGTISFRSFGRVLDLVPFGKYALNSLLVVAIAVPLSLLISSWAGFGMARLPRASQRRWLILSLAVLMIPGAALWSTRFVVFKQLGWLDSI